jgi:signal peptidase II
MDSPALEARWFHPVRILLAGLVLSTCIGCDQTTKYLATRTLKHQPRQTYWADMVRLEYALNSGGCLRLGGDLSPTARWWIFIGFNSLLTAGLCGYLVKHRHMSLPMYVALIAIIAGGLGNLIDRVFHQGLVTDFINIGVGPLRTGIFNVADVAITVGAIIALALSLWPARAASQEPPLQTIAS